MRRMTRTHLINRNESVARDLPRKHSGEEEEYPSWIFDRQATPPQWQRLATIRAWAWTAPKAIGVAPQSQNAWLCSFVAPCQPPARASRTPSLLMRWILSR